MKFYDLQKENKANKLDKIERTVNALRLEIFRLSEKMETQEKIDNWFKER